MLRLPAAFVSLVAAATLGATVPSPSPLTLVAPTTDPNGYPFNPMWAYQAAGFVSDPKVMYSQNHCPLGDAPEDADPCPMTSSLLPAAPVCNYFQHDGSTPYFGNCTSDNVQIDERTPTFMYAAGFVAFGCYNFDLQDLQWSSVHGHVNWGPATYEGTLRFSDSNQVGDHGPRALGLLPIGDGDVDFMLEPTDHYSGLLAGNRTAARVGLPGNDGMTIEMNIPEVLPKISALPYWHDFQENQEHEVAESATPSPAPAVVIGLLGVDTKHGAHAELHPVYGLAVLYRDGKGAAWNIFARNWGYEGGCSASPHSLGAPGKGSQRAGTLAFKLNVSGYSLDLHNSKGSSTDGEMWESPKLLGNEKALVTVHLETEQNNNIAWYQLALLPTSVPVASMR
jgi:hypothetical protein